MTSRTIVVNAVLEHFANSAIPGADSWNPEMRGQAEAFRETVLSIAAEKAAAFQQNVVWTQVGIHFTSAKTQEAFLGGSWAETVEQWLTTGRLRWFFFTRKPPGLRIRLGAPSFDPTLGSEFELLLQNERYEYGLYEAEIHQFGGELGMQLAHDFFTYDTCLLLRLRRLQAEKGIDEDAQVLSLLAVNHLLSGICDDAWEVWDAWRSLGLLTGRRFREDLPDNLKTRLHQDFNENRELFEMIVLRPSEALDSLSPQVRAIVETFFAKNAELAGSFRQAILHQRLLFGPRAILPFWIIFHWNRWGFSAVEQCFLADSMERLFNPKNVLIQERADR